MKIKKLKQYIKEHIQKLQEQASSPYSWWDTSNNSWAGEFPENVEEVYISAPSNICSGDPFYVGVGPSNSSNVGNLGELLINSGAPLDLPLSCIYYIPGGGQFYQACPQDVPAFINDYVSNVLWQPSYEIFPTYTAQEFTDYQCTQQGAGATISILVNELDNCFRRMNISMSTGGGVTVGDFLEWYESVDFQNLGASAFESWWEDRTGISSNLAGTNTINMGVKYKLPCVEGCTDSEANNYDENANADDGSCEYEGNINPHYPPEYQPFCCDINAINFGQMASGESYGMNPGEAEQYLMINGSQGDMCNNSICQGNVNPEDPCEDFVNYTMDNFGMPEDAFCAKCETGSIIDAGCDCCRPPEEESQGYNCRSGHMGGTSICVPCGPSGPCEFPNKNACLKSGCEKTSNYLEPITKKRLQKLAGIKLKKR